MARNKTVEKERASFVSRHDRADSTNLPLSISSIAKQWRRGNLSCPPYSPPGADIRAFQAPIWTKNQYE
jgi:hypothetical protein